MGWTEEGLRVIAEVTLTSPSNPGEVEYTDHVFRLPPMRVSVVWEITRGRGSFDSFGQIPASERVIARRHKSDATEETAAFIERLWADHHLNDTHAECDHMTPEMLSKHADETGTEWQTRMLSTVRCPETGYKWGHAWLARSVPEDVLERVATLIGTGS